MPNQELDPYRVGEIAGPAAFSAGDYVVIRTEKNVPAKVRCRNDDIAQSICVILGDENDAVYGEANYFASDLGYPLARELWSQSQRNWYERCHSEKYLLQIWQRRLKENSCPDYQETPKNNNLKTVTTKEIKINNYPNREEEFLNKCLGVLLVLLLVAIAIFGIGLILEYTNLTVLSHRVEKVNYSLEKVTITARNKLYSKNYSGQIYVINLPGDFVKLSGKLPSDFYCVKTYRTNLTHRIIYSIYPYQPNNCQIRDFEFVLGDLNLFKEKNKKDN